MIRIFERSKVLQDVLEEFELLGSLEYKKEVVDRTFFYTFRRRSFSVETKLFTSIVFTQNGSYIDLYYYTESDQDTFEQSLLNHLEKLSINYELIKE